MIVDMFKSGECYKAACENRRWERMTKEEIVKELRKNALSVGIGGSFFEYKGLDVYPCQDFIELTPTASDSESLTFSYDTIREVYFYHTIGSDQPSALRIITDYGIIVIALEDRDGQA